MTKIVKRDFQWYLDKWCESHVSSIIQVLAKYAESTWILGTSRGYSVPKSFKFTSLIWILPFSAASVPLQPPLVLLHLCFSLMPSWYDLTGFLFLFCSDFLFRNDLILRFPCCILFFFSDRISFFGNYLGSSSSVAFLSLSCSQYQIDWRGNLLPAA